MKTVKAALLVTLLVTAAVLEYRNSNLYNTKNDKSFVQPKKTNQLIQRNDGIQIIPKRTFVDFVDKVKTRRRLQHGRGGLAKVLHGVRKSNVNPLLVTVVDNTRLPFALNWLCHTKDMNIYKHVLMITTDRGIKQKIQKVWPKAHLTVLTQKFEISNHSNSNDNYAKLTSFRTLVVLELLLLKRQILQFQVDSVWFKNPIPFLSQFINYDILTNKVSKKSSEIPMGFLYLFPTRATISVYKQLNKKLHKLQRKRRSINHRKQISRDNYEQKYFSALMHKHFLRKRELPSKYFSDCKRYYRLREQKRTSMEPYVINWLLSNKYSVKRAAKFGHWFLNDDISCNDSKVRVKFRAVTF